MNIFSTFPADQYTFLNGTSMASPHVTGVAALFRSRLPGISATAAKAHLMLTARPVPALAGITVTGGVVNALAAIDDCNGNGLSDAQEIADGLVADCSGNGIPDSCEPDCNSNGIADSCDFLSGLLTDCSGNELPDQCEPDCDGDGVADSCVLFGGLDVDCDGNHIPDGCEPDCDGNGITDACDLRDGTHADCTGNGIPDVCEPDCDGDGVADSCAIAAGTATDCDDNGIPDSCDLAGGAPDCNGNGFPDACDPDCDFNGVPDDCDLAAGAPDCTGNGVLDACEFDCNENGQADSCEIAAGTLPDSNGDGVADVCVFGFQLVPVGASGPHTINGAEITLDSADQKVFLEVRMLGWNPLLADVPKLRAYQAAMEPASFTSGIGTPLDFSRIPCNIDADCPNGFFAPGLCQDGLCDAQSSHHVDETHPTFVFRGREATSGTFRNAGFPPFAGSVVVDPARSVRFSRTPQYGVTVALEVPAGASGRYVVRFFEDQTFWLAENATNIPVPQFEPAIIVLPQDCNGNGIEDRIEIATGTAADCNGNAIPDECLSFEADCNANGLVDECEIADGSTPDVNGNGIPDACETARIFVDVSAMGAANGQSWADAFPDLQDALDFTVAAGGTVRELWVAAGVYVPSRPTMAADNRTRTFTLLDGVALYGGFAGGETSLDQRDVETNAAVLSGDQLGNDGPNFTGNADNSYHVVLAKNVDRGAVLDGFAVIAGHADGAAIRDFNIGGGLFVLDATPTVSRCTFRQNRANIGAGMAVKNLTTPSPDRNVQVDQCRFLDNLGNVGGAVFTHFDTEFTARYCRFIGNRGLIDAGAVKTGDFRTRSTFLNCLFSGNRVTGTHGQGGAMLVTNGSTNTLINCTVVNNSSPDPPGGLAMGGADVTLFNSVIWGNRGNASSTEVDQVFVSTSGAVAVSLGHNDIEGWTGILGGIGNIGDDPQFFDPDGPDNIVGTIDDDLHVTASSPAVNAGDNSVVPTDLLIDLDGQPRVFSLAVDMGVYEIGVPPDCAGVNQ
ncbi:MAG: S8 family serine peptidase, partial [Phycisphaerae bacterium]